MFIDTLLLVLLINYNIRMCADVIRRDSSRTKRNGHSSFSAQNGYRVSPCQDITCLSPADRYSVVQGRITWSTCEIPNGTLAQLSYCHGVCKRCHFICEKFTGCVKYYLAVHEPWKDNALPFAECRQLPPHPPRDQNTGYEMLHHVTTHMVFVAS